jgi:hypothetical protein
MTRRFSHADLDELCSSHSLRDLVDVISYGSSALIGCGFRWTKGPKWPLPIHNQYCPKHKFSAPACDKLAQSKRDRQKTYSSRETAVEIDIGFVSEDAQPTFYPVRLGHFLLLRKSSELYARNLGNAHKANACINLTG